jgi:hypothetical protein
MSTVAAPSPYPPHAILTTEQVATWLAVPPRYVARLKIPQLALGHRTRRYRAADVQAWLSRQLAAFAAEKEQQRKPKRMKGRRS